MPPWNFQLAAGLLGVLLVLGMQMTREMENRQNKNGKKSKTIKCSFHIRKYMLIYFQSIFLKISKCIALSVNSKNISEIYAFNFKFLRAGDD